MLPPQNMLNATKEFIEYSLENGYLSPDYTLLGHRQVRDTICPGPALYQEIEKWPRFGSDVHFPINSIL